MIPQFQQQNPYLFQISNTDIEDKITKVKSREQNLYFQSQVHNGSIINYKIVLTEKIIIGA